MFELPTNSQGSGPDVVLVHGALGDRRQWDPIATALAPRFRTHAVSRRHHWPGPMPAASERYTYELHRDDVLALMQRLDDPVHLVGHSYGAGSCCWRPAGAGARAASRSSSRRSGASSRSRRRFAGETTRVAALPGAAVGPMTHRGGRDIDWAGRRRLRAAWRAQGCTKRSTLGPTIAGSQPDVSPASLSGCGHLVIGEQTRGSIG
jgi:pimeloyl-ACP methyl ester carboxylesterase